MGFLLLPLTFPFSPLSPPFLGHPHRVPYFFPCLAGWILGSPGPSLPPHPTLLPAAWGIGAVSGERTGRALVNVQWESEWIHLKGRERKEGATLCPLGPFSRSQGAQMESLVLLSFIEHFPHSCRDTTWYHSLPGAPFQPRLPGKPLPAQRPRLRSPRGSGAGSQRSSLQGPRRAVTGVCVWAGGGGAGNVSQLRVGV